MVKKNRESYLQCLVTEYRGDLLKIGVKLPQLHISVGHTGMGRTIGVTYARQHSPDGRNQVFISPQISNTEDVMKVVAHECVHAALDTHFGHGKEFTTLARQIGLTKPYTCSISGPVLEAKIKQMINKYGKYPHPGFITLVSPPTKCLLSLDKC